MYPEGDSGGDSSPDYYNYGGGLKSNLVKNFEGFIPLILIVIIGFFLLAKFNVLTTATPVVGPLVAVVSGETDSMDMLIVGTPSTYSLDVLNENRDVVKYRIKTAADLERNPAEQLAQYDLVMLDQSNQTSKEISRQLGDALENYVKKGGKLIVVKDSAVRRPDTFDVIGWKATLGDIMPVTCDRTINNQPSCTQPINVVGKVRRQVEKHPIMAGIEVAPAEPGDDMILSTFDVTVKGTEIAYMDDSRGNYFTAIAEAKIIIGKVIYFNYDPGKTRGIFENTLDYLR